jgi:SAM-dependent methyltransferase
MHRRYGSVHLLVLGALLCCGLAGCGPSEPGTASVYTERERTDSTGTGKVYMGREIARVVDQEHGEDWLERPGRETAELPERLLQALDLRASTVVADIGAGTGYFTFRISPRVPRGDVLAVDIQPAMLDVIRARRDSLGWHNIELILGQQDNPNLPADAVDVALIVSSYHEFSHPYEMMTNIVRALKPGGRLVLVEYRGEDPTIPVAALHRMTQAQAKKEMAAVGLVWRETRDILPQQHLMIFEKPLPGTF